jgi:hypothetical protein
VAVAAVAHENTETGREVNRNVEMLPLAKSDGRWMIAAQARDRETASLPMPYGDVFRAMPRAPSWKHPKAEWSRYTSITSPVTIMVTPTRIKPKKVLSMRVFA